MTLVMSLMVVLAAAPDGGESRQQSGQRLNDEGEALSKQGKFQDAELKFLEAFQRSPRLAAAHYNFAATASRLLEPCNGDHGQIVRELQTSIALDPSRRARALKDSDFKNIRRTVAYQLLFGADLNTKAGVETVVSGVDWHHGRDGQSDWGVGVWFKFLPGGRAKYGERVESGEGDGWRVDWVERQGSWKVAEGKNAAGGVAFVVVFEVPAGHGLPAFREVGTVTASGTMVFDQYWLVDGPGACGG